MTIKGNSKNGISIEHRVNRVFIAICLTFCLPDKVFGENININKHAETKNYSFRIDNYHFRQSASDNFGLDLDGWIGGPKNKLWLKASGALSQSKLDSAELWGLYSRNINQNWDAQIGIKHQIKPEIFE